MEPLNHDQWVDLLDEVMKGDYRRVEPTLVRDAEPARVAIGLYAALSDPSARNLFADAIVAQFESTPPRPINASKIFNLLHVIAYVLPSKAKRLVRRRLFDNSLSNLQYPENSTPLSLLCLSVAGNYDVDDELTDYIHAKNRSAVDFEFRLVSLRLLATRSGKDVFELLDETIAAAKDSRKARQLVTEMRPILIQRGCHFLFEWFLSKEDRLAEHKNDEIQLFLDTLKTSVFKKSRLYQPESDPYVTLLTAFLHKSLVTAEDVVRLAELAAGHTSQVGRDTKFVLSRISYHVNDPYDPAIRRMASISQALVTTKYGRFLLDPETNTAVLAILHDAQHARALSIAA
jgi:hypothetical protein